MAATVQLALHVSGQPAGSVGGHDQARDDSPLDVATRRLQLDPADDAHEFLVHLDVVSGTEQAGDDLVLDQGRKLARPVTTHGSSLLSHQRRRRQIFAVILAALAPFAIAAVALLAIATISGLTGFGRFIAHLQRVMS